MTTLFTIPIVFLQCMTWDAFAEGTISGFKLEQPVSILAEHSVTARIGNMRVSMLYNCVPLVTKHNGTVYITGDITFEGYSESAFRIEP